MEHSNNKAFYKRKLIWVIGIFIILVLAGSGSEEKPPAENQVVKVVEKQVETKIIPYEVVNVDDTSYTECSRRSYDVIVSDDATQNEVKDAVLDLHKKKRNLSNKIFIFAYFESQREKIGEWLYIGRLSMDADCSSGNAYEVDFEYWDIDWEVLEDGVSE